MNYSDFPESVSKMKKLLKDYERDYSLKVSLDNKNAFIIGMSKNNLFSEIQFINAINNTKNNFLLSVDNYLKYMKNDKLLPTLDDKPFVEIVNPYFDNPQYFWLENMAIRVGSLWDEFAHLCNIFYNIGFDASHVQASNIFTQKNDFPIIKDVYKYFEESTNFSNNNCHKFVKEIRNRLIHYCDFKAIKFFSEYLKEKDPLSFLPVGVYFGYIMFDYFSFIEIFDRFMCSFEKQLQLK